MAEKGTDTQPPATNQFRVDSASGYGPSIGVYPTRNEAESAARVYGGTIVEVGRDGIDVAYWTTDEGKRMRQIMARGVR